MVRSPSQSPNLLLISIEDLNDYIEPLGGHPEVITPNLKRLAAMSTLFTNTFAAAPACSPARTAVLFGKWPWQSGIYTNKQKWYDAFAPGRDETLYGRFRRAGFQTFGAGKIFYAGLIDSDWDGYFKEPNDPYRRQSPLQKAHAKMRPMIDYGPAEDEGPLYDERNAAHIMARFEPGAQGQVWSLGIYRPHMPFIAPKRFFDLYPETVAVAPALKERMFDPFSSAEVAGLPREPLARIVRNAGFGKKLFESQQYNAFLRAYLASISYADWVLGQVLDRLEAQGLMDNTYIALWSDHGYHFGEKNHFHKFSLWERSLRTPMMFSGPGIAPRSISRPVSNVDLGPTLLDLLGIERGDFAAGQSLRPVLEGGPEDGLPPVVSVYGFPKEPKKSDDDDDDDDPAPREHFLAWSVRSDSHRLVSYWNGGMELYDHRVDPYEHDNLLPVGKLRRVPRELRGTVDALAALIPQAPLPAVPPRSVVTRLPEGGKDYPHWVRSVG